MTLVSYLFLYHMYFIPWLRARDLLCFTTDLFLNYIEDLTRVVILYEIY